MESDPEISAEEVRRRFAWARRQGHPAWLWPETPIPAWRAALRQIEAATAAVLAGRTARLEGDPQALGLAGYTSGTGPLLGCWLEQGRLAAEAPAAAELQRHLAHNRIRSSRLAGVASEVVAGMADDGVEVLVLKGAHTGPAYFPEPGARPASDIDLLAPASHLARAEAALGALGLALKARGRWESNWRAPSSPSEPRTLSYLHADDPWSIDLHSALRIFVGEGAPAADLGRGDPMASRDRWGADPRARVLEPPLLVLHLAAHAGAGWQNLTLLRQIELVLVIRREVEAGRLMWPEMLELGGRTGVLGFAYPALRLAEKLAPDTVPRDVLEACAARATPAVRRAVECLTPASAQRIDRISLAEHFMWTSGWRGRLRQLAADLAPDVRSWSQLLGIYEERAWRVIRGRVSQ